ncbi:SGNH/GDSL hydrolase family protein [Paraburkholderia phenazinium]|uniref:Lysophospholipase L1 n=1 Tax=Paraburkholderia phenazinium TaxID=60549 RepID=A0A1G8HT07_9BURK|nr:SGNH/GDSL hydrolase family protein [Paraburkholderia phenazinium]SDI09785.1 Lysophospholipase L1 [Paraburkholderia phenazinium]
MKISALRHIPAALWLASLAVSASASVTPAASTANPHWVDAWAASPDSAGPPLAASTLRQVVRTSIGGAAVRIRLSNLYGSGPITLGPVHIAAHASGSSIRPGTDHALTFGGKTTVTIAKGAEVLSDPAAFPVSALEELAVTLYVAPGAGATTTHLLGQQTAFIARGADATAALSLPDGKAAAKPNADPDDSRYFLTDVQVAATPQAHTLVALGDSITDGAGSTEDRNARWPDALAARLHADPAFATVAVVDAGIAGNRILHNGADPFLGPSALSRFERDAIDTSGVHWILLLEGINDIAAADVLKTPEANVSAEQIIGGMKVLIARAHAKHLKIWGATLTPFAGANAPFYTAAGEAKRAAVNRWIRTAGAFDAVVDFDQAVRDPAHPDRLLPAFDSGDHVHPNDAGYQAMAAAIDPHLFAENK